jgi:hypothetical protein
MLRRDESESEEKDSETIKIAEVSESTKEGNDEIGIANLIPATLVLGRDLEKNTQTEIGGLTG